MRSHRQVYGAALAALMGLAASAAAAQEAPASGSWPGAVGVSLDVSVLLGIGVSVGVPLGDRFNLRAAHHRFSYDREFEDGDATYDSTLELNTTGLMADWHPFSGVFRLTGGLLSNGNNIQLTATDNGNGEYDVGDCTYVSDGADPLRIDGAVDFQSTAPYLGLGWGGNMNSGPGFYGLFDMGVMMSGAPSTRLRGSGSASAKSGQSPSCGDPNSSQPVEGYAEFQEQVRNAENDVNEETRSFKLWPNISFGVGWRF